MSRLASFPIQGDVREMALSVARRYGEISELWLLTFSGVAEIHREKPQATYRPYAGVQLYRDGAWRTIR